MCVLHGQHTSVWTCHTSSAQCRAVSILETMALECLESRTCKVQGARLVVRECTEHCNLYGAGTGKRPGRRDTSPRQEESKRRPVTSHWRPLRKSSFTGLEFRLDKPLRFRPILTHSESRTDAPGACCHDNEHACDALQNATCHSTHDLTPFSSSSPR